jgi:hypothetical protein
MCAFQFAAENVRMYRPARQVLENVKIPYPSKGEGIFFYNGYRKFSIGSEVVGAVGIEPTT